jgi:Cu2+-exporting ATPase
VGTADGKRLAVGSPPFVRQLGVTVSPDMAAAETELVQSRQTPVLVAFDGQCIAVIGLADAVRDDVPAALQALQQVGWQVRILSGDHPQVVADVGHQLGIDAGHVLGGRTPEEKVRYIEQAAGEGRVVMVGDGVNDAAALSAATVGIAVHGGAESSLAAADVYLNRPGLMPIVELTRAARNTLRTIHRSLIVSLFYNVLAASLAVAGLIGPLFAAILMPISSFTVLALAYLSPTFGGKS